VTDCYHFGIANTVNTDFGRCGLFDLEPRDTHNIRNLRHLRRSQSVRSRGIPPSPPFFLLSFHSAILLIFFSPASPRICATCGEACKEAPYETNSRTERN